MEVRLVCESDGVIAHCEVDEKGVMTAYNSAGPPVAVPFFTRDAAINYARKVVNRWKRVEEEEFRKKFGEEPVGVMSETGITIEEVE